MEFKISLKKQSILPLLLIGFKLKSHPPLYLKQSIQVIIFGILLSGIMTWSIGRENYHIGASGLIYVLFSFIINSLFIIRESKQYF